MNFHRFNVNEDSWSAYLITDEDHVIAEEDSAAETDFHKREIYFRRGDLSLADVRHELYHVFFGYTFTRSATLSPGQMEEVAAELFAERGERISQLAVEIFEQLKAMRDVEDEK
jgi:hypothetical protein